MDNVYREREITVGGQAINVIEAGKSGRQIALLIHGWSSSWFATSPLLELLAQRFHCFSVDLPGYGQSAPFEERATIPRYVELLANLIEGVSEGPVVLVGHSMGGMISITLALTYPVLVERMVLLSPTISGRLSTSINILISPITMLERFGLGSLLVSSVERTVVGLTDRLMRPVSFAERSGITRQNYERIRHDARRPGQGRVRAECFTAMQENDLSGRLGKIETPALILWGAEDNTVPLRDAGVVADEWPEADLRIIPKAGHWPHFETPDITRRQVAAYLGLPRFSDQIHTPVDENELVEIKETAQFLAHSAIGNDLNLAQRTRLAAQLQCKIFKPGETIVHASAEGEELFIIQHGIVQVWKDPEGIEPHLHTHQKMQHMANLHPGQITGELALLDKGTRSADLIAGPEGTTLLTINRERLLALCEDDAVLGTRLMWNTSTAMARRVRFVLWQLNRAQERRLATSSEVSATEPAAERTFIGKVPDFVSEKAQSNVEA